MAPAASLTILYAESRPVDPRVESSAPPGEQEYGWYQSPPLPRTELRAALAETERPLGVRVVLNASTRHLTMALGGVDIVHLSLHALHDQRFVLSDEQGLADYVSAGRLARLLLPLHSEDRVPLVILATPYSHQLAPALRAAGIPAIVAVDHSHALPPAALRVFYTALYSGLADGHSPIQAFRQARRVVARHPTYGDHFHPSAPDGHALPPFSQRFRLFLAAEPQPLRPAPLPRGAMAWEEPALPATVPHPPRTFLAHGRLLAETVLALTAPQGAQLVTLVGEDGMGKSSLAAEAVQWLSIHGHFPGGIRWFRCAEIQPPLARILSPRLDELLENWPDTGEGRRLLVLDGLEALQGSLQGNERLPDLLDAALGRVGLHLLVTGQAPLGLESAERVIEVGPLSPAQGRALFAEQVGPLISSGWSGLEWDTMDHLCTLLGYSPLALRMAGAFTGQREASLLGFHDTLDTIFTETTEESATEPPVQNTLRALLSVMLGSLDSATINLFYLLGAFPSGAAPAALDMLIGADRWRTMADELRALNLVSDEGGRLFEGDVLRAISTEGLAPGDWWHVSAWYLQRTLEMHALLVPAERETLALRLFGQATPHLSPSEAMDLRRAVDFFDRELPNILAVVQFLVQVRAWTRVADLVERVHLYLRLRGLTAEQAWAAEQAVIAAERCGDSERLAQALLNKGEIALVQGRFADAERAFQESLSMFQGRQDPSPAANVLHSLGTVYLNQERLTEAEAAFQQSIALFEEVRDPFHLAAAYHNLGNVYKEDQRWADAERALRQSLTNSEAIGDQLGLAETLSVLGLVLDYQQQAEEARLVTERALEIAREARVPELEAAILWNLGSRWLERGDVIPGLRQMAACVAIERELNHPDAELDAATLRELLVEHAVDPAAIDFPLHYNLYEDDLST